MDKIVGMCTIPERISTLPRVLRSLHRQVDKIELALNGFKEIPTFLKAFPKVNATLTTNEKGDANKYYSIGNHKNVYYLSCDDDIIYPYDYVSKMTRLADKYKCLITVHGSNIPRKLTNYYTGKVMKSHCLNSCNEVEVNIPGTGVSCFNTSILNIDYNRFESPNMADIWVGLQCEEQGIKRIAIKHSKGWIKGGLNKGRDTIYDSHKYNCKIQTDLVNSIKWKNL